MYLRKTRETWSFCIQFKTNKNSKFILISERMLGIIQFYLINNYIK